MRTLIVGFMSFVFMAAVLWICGAFISAVWNPMLWDAFGRFFYVMMVFCIAGPVGVFGGAWFEEEMKRKRQR